MQVSSAPAICNANDLRNFNPSLNSGDDSPALKRAVRVTSCPVPDPQTLPAPQLLPAPQVPRFPLPAIAGRLPLHYLHLCRQV